MKARASASDSASATKNYIEAFSPFPKKLGELSEQGLVHCQYEPTAAGLAARGAIEKSDIRVLIQKGFVHLAGQRYEDFLPFSAAGIFASNLKQYGTQCTAAQKPSYTQATLEEVLGQRIVDPVALCCEVERRSLQETYEKLGLLDERPTKVQKFIDSPIIGG